ncbi:MAG: PEGA domain-containing protein [Polyangiaceae bacterium]|nr:PEGA domain-containing protein [Polyangiaceae bacterium]
MRTFIRDLTVVASVHMLLAFPAAAQTPTPGMRSGSDLPIEPGCNCICGDRSRGAAESSQPLDDVARLAEAKLLFQKGNDLRKLGDCGRALILYEKSRALVPSKPNTQNWAYCLEQLGRTDEAYDAYEILLTSFVSELSADEVRSVNVSLTALRPRLSLLRTSANVDGLLVVDGRSRGRLPAAREIRILPGEHIVRVVKDGWASFEKTVTVKSGEATSIDARLTPLAESGRLRVEDERLTGADLFIDGALVGQLPWEGSLAPGPHYYSVRKGDLGSAPREANVVRGQVTLATVEAGPLAGELRILTDPKHAALTIDGVPVGRGIWRGRLPVGRHKIEVEEDGYVTYVSRPSLDPSHSGEMAIKLDVDPSHPKWGNKQGTPWISAFGGPLLASSLGSKAEEKCDLYDSADCPDDRRERPLGPLGGVRGGYEFPNGLSAFAGVGYLAMRASLTRSLRATVAAVRPENATIDGEFTISDAISFHGPFFAVGAKYRLEFAQYWYGTAGISIGSIFVDTRDVLTISVQAGGANLPVNVVGAGEPISSAAPFLMPELGFGIRMGRYFGEVGFSVIQVLVAGPPHETRDVSVRNQKPCTENEIGTAHCIRNPTALILTEERSYGALSAFLPRLEVGVRF